MAFSKAAYEKKRKAWKSRKSMRWWPAINQARRSLQNLAFKIETNKKKNLDVRDDLAAVIRALNFFMDAAILQMDDTDDRLKELEEMVVNNLIQLTPKEMNSITQKVSKELF